MGVGNGDNVNPQHKIAFFILFYGSVICIHYRAEYTFSCKSNASFL